MLQRFLDPATLASISSLDLVAKTVVDGFVAGMHRSPDFGFSQEFAEYRAYSEGDDLRHVDWNVFARTDKCFLKRYRGETNSQLLLLLDTSASMGYGSHSVHKLDPQEIKPKFRDPVLLYDVENTVNSLEVSPEYARNEYRKRIDGHIEALSSKARSAGLDYFLMDTSRPLDEGLREYLAVRKGRL